MAGLYLYGLLDAALSEGSARVKVTDPQGGQLTLGPSAYGIGLTYSF
jgi:hypothetical protein